MKIEFELLLDFAFLALPYMLMLWGWLLIVLFHLLTRSPFYTFLITVFLCRHSLSFIKCDMIYDLYHEHGKTIARRVFHIDYRPCEIRSKQTSHEQQPVIYLFHCLNSNIHESFLLLLYTHITRGGFPCSNSSIPIHYIAHPSFILDMPLVRHFMYWIGVRSLHYNRPFTIESNTSYVFVIRDRYDMQAIWKVINQQNAKVWPFYISANNSNCKNITSVLCNDRNIVNVTLITSEQSKTYSTIEQYKELTKQQIKYNDHDEYFL